MNEDKFTYKYSAPTEAERKEINGIRQQYINEGKGESKMERLRTLHAKVRNSAISIALTVGILGCLLFGVGLTMILEWKITLWGVLIAAIGTIPMLVSYPIYTWILKRNKNKYGEEIVRLSEELLEGK